MELVLKHFAKVRIVNVFEILDTIYQMYLLELITEQIESLEVSYKHLAEAEPILAAFLAKAPAEMLKIFDEVAFKVALRYYPNYGEIHRQTHVRIVDLPTFHTLRDLRYIFQYIVL